MPVPPEAATAEIVRLLARRGFSVFPVPVPRVGAPAGSPGDGKTPALPWAQWQTARADEDQINAWFRTPQNVAVVCGAISGLVVVDADADDARRWAVARLPRTPLQVKTPRGWHLYYMHPGTPIRNRARIRTPDGAIALDVRGDGGYVIGPFSLHASGERYWPLCQCGASDGWDSPDAPVPTFDPSWLDVPPPAVPRRPAGSARPLSTRAERGRRYLSRIPVPVIGQGSDATVFRVACRLVRTLALDAESAVDLLDAWAGGQPGWDRGWIASKVEHALRYGTEPIGGDQ